MKRKSPIEMQSMSDAEFITEARKRNKMSIANTFAGEWLKEALRRLDLQQKPIEGNKHGKWQRKYENFSAEGAKNLADAMFEAMKEAGR